MFVINLFGEKNDSMNKNKLYFTGRTHNLIISGGKNIHLYAAAKSALNTLTTALSKDSFRRKIKIISIVPRRIDTLTFRKNNNIKNNKDLILFKRRKKIKNIKTPSEFANFIYKRIIRKPSVAKKPILYFDSF